MHHQEAHSNRLRPEKNKHEEMYLRICAIAFMLELCYNSGKYII
jgi:hypothetical protein